MSDTDTTVVRNDEESRYEVRVSDEVAGFAEFRTDEQGRIVLTHTEIDSRMSGRGLGSTLVGGTLADLAARGDTVVPECPFVASYLEKNYVDGLTLASPESS